MRVGATQVRKACVGSEREETISSGIRKKLEYVIFILIAAGGA
jgi:hypothetical protein